MNRDNWIWMPHAGHLIVGHECRFFLNTYLGNGYLVSTVGEWWPDTTVRRIHAQIHDPKWLDDNSYLRGEEWDGAYKKRFGFHEIGVNAIYETMVFRAIPEETPEFQCCPWHQIPGSDVQTERYNDAVGAYQGHLILCDNWSREAA